MLVHMQLSPFQADLTNWMLFTKLNNMKNGRGKEHVTHATSALQAGLWDVGPGRGQEHIMHTQPVPRGSELTQASLFETAQKRPIYVVGEVPTIDQYPSRFPWYTPERQRKQNLLDQAGDIIQEALDVYDPSHVFILLSGGNDSLVSTLVATDFMKRQRTIPSYVVHINTGIGAERTRQFVRLTARDFFEWPFLEYKTTESYDQAVTENGFPGGAAHLFMYTLLKERPLRQLVRDHTPDTRPNEYRWNRRDRDGKRERWPPKVMFISGARREESRRRMGHVEAIQREDRRIWVAPLTEWTKQDVDNYLAPLRGSIPHNPVPDILHYSGECFCGSFAEKGELAMIKVFFPDEAARIERLTEVARANGFSWEWDEEPPDSFFESRNGQMALDGFQGHAHLCTSCDYRMSANRRTIHDASHEGAEQRA